MIWHDTMWTRKRKGLHGNLFDSLICMCSCSLTSLLSIVSSFDAIDDGGMVVLLFFFFFFFFLVLL